MDDEQRPPEAVGMPARRTPAAPLGRVAMTWTAVLLALLTIGAVVVLWWPATRGLNGSELVSARFDGLKIGLSIGVGSGGVIALYLSWRRQRSTEAELDNRERALQHQQQVAADAKGHQERLAEDARTDAIERRITELYTKAVEQLGSNKAPVRLGGLYALERLGQNNPSQRSTIINVICAYLRMPFEVPIDVTGEPLEDNGGYREEEQVRRTAQRIFGWHRIRGGASENLWDVQHVDLAGANLAGVRWAAIDLDGADLTGANLTGAVIVSSNLRSTFLRRANFTGALLDRSDFTDAGLEMANFTNANLKGTDFTRARLLQAKFKNADLGRAKLQQALYGASADFTDVRGDPDFPDDLNAVPIRVSPAIVREPGHKST
ncbi:pentapeptide repeat-containing protein [Amycolatopsis sp. NPDC005232]|uniref:pentapeptide repeat-containing protein n=1 Tax=Amycolatopsis sp. NPDC005232 TaxID=3157027 RepID=UPI0033BEB2E3